MSCTNIMHKNGCESASKRARARERGSARAHKRERVSACSASTSVRVHHTPSQLCAPESKRSVPSPVCCVEFAVLKLRAQIVFSNVVVGVTALRGLTMTIEIRHQFWAGKVSKQHGQHHHTQRDNKHDRDDIIIRGGTAALHTVMQRPLHARMAKIHIDSGSIL